MFDKAKNITLILLGNFILVFGVAMFILPYNILSGGVAGVVVALSPVISINRELLIDILNISLFFIGWLILGKDFALKTFICALTYPLFLRIITPLISVVEIDPILASIYGGIICGAGVGIVMRHGASTGGMDIPPLVLHKLTGLKISTLVMVIDALTVLLGMVTYGLPAVLIGLLSVFTTSIAMDKMLNFGGAESKAVWIISDEFEKINEKILNEMNRSTTIVDATGGYSKKGKRAMLCVVSARQYSKLLSIIDEFDEYAFVIATNANDVRGEGFTLGIRV